MGDFGHRRHAGFTKWYKGTPRIGAACNLEVPAGSNLCFHRVENGAGKTTTSHSLMAS